MRVCVCGGGEGGGGGVVGYKNGTLLQLGMFGISFDITAFYFFYSLSYVVISDNMVGFEVPLFLY